MKRMKQNAGFTLVELVVVIAILGILGGVGTVGYSGYVKKAQMEADRTTVSNIIRAAETGQYAFDYSLPLQLSGSGIKLPVGFVVLTNEGGVQTVQGSQNIVTEEADTACSMGVLQTSGNVYIVNDASSFVSTKTTNTNTITAGIFDSTMYSSSALSALTPVTEIQYCTAHSNPTKYEGKIGDTAHYAGLGIEGGFWGFGGTNHAANYYNSCQSVVVYDLSGGGLFDSSNGHEEGKMFSAELYGGGGPAVNDANGVIPQVLNAAYGPSYTSLTLEYPDWGKGSEGEQLGISSGMPSLMNHSNQILNLVDEAIDVMTGGGLLGAGASLVISQEDRAQYINDYAVAVGAQKEQYIEDWNKVDENNNAWTGEGVFLGFTRDGTNISAKVTRTAAVLSYNTAFYTYLEDRTDWGGHSSKAEMDSHITAMKGWTDTGGTIKDPYLVCKSAFENSASTLPEAVKNCTHCKGSYTTYVSSNACAQNGDVMGNTMGMIRDNKEAVDNYVATGITGNVFDYYETYLNEFQNVYGKANELSAGKSAIVITVYQSDNGALDFEVAPKEADPRNAS